MMFCAQPYLKPCFMCPFYILSTCPSKGLCTALHIRSEMCIQNQNDTFWFNLSAFATPKMLASEAFGVTQNKIKIHILSQTCISFWISRLDLLTVNHKSCFCPGLGQAEHTPVFLPWATLCHSQRQSERKRTYTHTHTQTHTHAHTHPHTHTHTQTHTHTDAHTHTHTHIHTHTHTYTHTHTHTHRETVMLKLRARTFDASHSNWQLLLPFRFISRSDSLEKLVVF